MVVQYEAYRLYPIENIAAVTDNAVNQFAAFSNLCGLFRRTVNRQILKLVYTLYVSGTPYLEVFQNTAVLDNRSAANTATPILRPPSAKATPILRPPSVQAT